MTAPDLPMRERIKLALYLEAIEAEDGDAVWDDPEGIREEIEGWSRFADAVLDLWADLPDTAVEAGAEALHDPEDYPCFTWDELPEGMREDYRHRFRTAAIAAIKEGKA